MDLGSEFALADVTLIDGNGGVPVKDMTIVVKNGVIEKIGDGRSLGLEADLQKIDVKGLYVIPGLIDTHVHLMGISSDNPVDWITESNYLKAIRTVNEVKNLIEHGFTTIRSAGSMYDVYLKRAIEEKTIVGPRILACGRGLSRVRGHGDPIRRDIYEIPDEWARRSNPWFQECDGVDEIRKTIRKLLAQNIDHVKFLATGGSFWKKDSSLDMHYSMEEMKTIVAEARMVGLKVMCHAENVAGIRAAVEIGVDTIEHCHPSAYETDELDQKTCEAMYQKNIYITPTISVYFVGPWGVKEIRKSYINGWKRAIQNGVKVLLGSDPFAGPHYTPMGQYNVGEIKQLVDVLGMTPLEAITSATKFGAEACGIDANVGTIEQGKMADLLVVKKDPSADIDTLLDKDNIKYVIKEGKLAAGY